jgi:hypothetical protein
MFTKGAAILFNAYSCSRPPTSWYVEPSVEVHFTPSLTFDPANTTVKARDGDRFQLVTVEFNRLPFGIMFSKGKQVRGRLVVLVCTHVHACVCGGWG